MPFAIGKLLGYLAYPSTMLIVALLLGVAASFLPAERRPWRTIGRVLLVAAVLADAVVGFTPSWVVLMRPLETRFPALADDAPEPAGIILIGGMIDGSTEATVGRPKMLMGIEAIDLTIALARRHPHVPIVFSGTGTIEADGADYTEAATMARAVAAAGIDAGRFVYERRARTTWENAVFSHGMIEPRAGARWLLVTPAWHMPRSIAAFRAAGWDGIVAAPSIGETARTGGGNAPPSERLRLFDVAVREWTGLVAYRVLGRSTSVFPAP